MAFTDQDLSALKPIVWSKKIQQRFDKLIVMKKLVNTDFQGEIKSSGSSVRVPRLGDVTVSSYTENSTMSLTEVAVTTSDLSINQKKSMYFGIDKVTEAQSSIKGLLDRYADRAAVAIANTIDSRLLTHYADADAANILYSAAAPLSMTPSNVYPLFVNAGARLAAQGVKGDVNIVIPTELYSILLQAPEFTQRSTAETDKVIKNGTVGVFANMNVHVTTNMARTSGAWPIMFFTKDFISFAMQVTEIEFEKPTGTFVDACKMLYVYGSQVLTGHAVCGGTAYVSC